MPGPGSTEGTPKQIDRFARLEKKFGAIKKNPTSQKEVNQILNTGKGLPDQPFNKSLEKGINVITQERLLQVAQRLYGITDLDHLTKAQQKQLDYFLHQYPDLTADQIYEKVTTPNAPPFVLEMMKRRKNR